MGGHRRGRPFRQPAGVRHWPDAGVCIWEGFAHHLAPPNHSRATRALHADNAPTLAIPHHPTTATSHSCTQVPLFIEIGSMIKVDTRTGQYLSKAN